MQEALLPVGVAEVDLDRLDTVRPEAGDPLLDVGHLEGEVVRALPVVLQEAHQEVVVRAFDGLKRLEPDAAGKRGLCPPPAPFGETRDLAAAGAAAGALQRVVDTVDTDREVVEQDWLGDDRC